MLRVLGAHGVGGCGGRWRWNWGTCGCAGHQTMRAGWGRCGAFPWALMSLPKPLTLDLVPVWAKSCPSPNPRVGVQALQPQDETTRQAEVGFQLLGWKIIQRRSNSAFASSHL